MKYMEWSWADYMVCPDDLLPVIAEIAEEEAARLNESRSRASARRPRTR